MIMYSRHFSVSLYIASNITSFFISMMSELRKTKVGVENGIYRGVENFLYHVTTVKELVTTNLDIEELC